MHKPGRIFFYLAIANRQTIGEREQSAVPVDCGRRPILLVKPALYILCRDGFGGAFSKPPKQSFHAACIVPVTELVSFRVRQSVLGDIGERNGCASETLRKFFPLQGFRSALVHQLYSDALTASLLASFPTLGIPITDPPLTRVPHFLEHAARIALRF